MSKPCSAEYAHRAVLSLTRYRRSTERTNLWKIGVAAGPPGNWSRLTAEAIQLANECPPSCAIISEDLYNELSPRYRNTYLPPEEIAGYRACRTVPYGQRRCFCVLPIGAEDSPERCTADFVFQHLITPACQKLGYLPVHPLKQHGTDIWSDIANSLLAFEHVIVYLGPPPYTANVMLELGYRMATGKPMVVLASLSDGTRLPFDLQNHRAVPLPVDPTAIKETDLQQYVEEIVAKMNDRARNDLSWGDLYPTATIEVDTRPVPPDVKDHKIADASQHMADLFAIELSALIGMPPNEVMEQLRELMDPHQYKAFAEEQTTLYTQLGYDLGFVRGSRRTVHAEVPIVLLRHPDPAFFLRAYLPAVLSHEQIGDRSLQRVVYIDVSRHIRRDERGIWKIPRPAPNLDFVFAKYAEAYDAVLCELPNYRGAIEQHCTLSAPRASMTMLDIGAGTGNLTVRFLEAGAHVTAVDRSPEMLHILARKCEPYRERLMRVVRDCTELPMFQRDQFHVVNIMLVLFSVEQPRRILREAMRVLRPGGTLVVTEPNRRFDLDVLLGQAEQYLHSVGCLDRLQESWELVKKVNLSFQTALHDGWKVEDVEAELNNLGWEIGHFDAYEGHCTTLRAIKPA
jgi:ubiquinone/menaquinone biosynthesis C-methylase UbiE